MRDTIPGMDHQVRDRAMKLVMTKKHLNEARNLNPYIEAMHPDRIWDAGPAAAIKELAADYPANNPDIREWTRYTNRIDHMLDTELDPWAERVIDLARKDYERLGPAQREF